MAEAVEQDPVEVELELSSRQLALLRHLAERQGVPLEQYISSVLMEELDRREAIRKRDEDLQALSREDLIAEVIKLRNGIQADAARTGHNLCWYRPELWSLVPGCVLSDPQVPPWDEFVMKCVAYRRTLDPEPEK